MITVFECRNPRCPGRDEDQSVQFAVSLQALRHGHEALCPVCREPATETDSVTRDDLADGDGPED